MKTGLFTFIACTCLLAACATPPPEQEPPQTTIVAPPPATAPVEKAATPPSPTPDVQALAKGIEAYENSHYRNARKLIESALSGQLDPSDQVRAYKYLAFIACANGQTGTCRTHFRKALAIDPDFALNHTEAGHPTWGKIFREVKAERSKAKR